MFLVQHGKGITCSRLYRSESDKIVLCSRQLPYAPLDLTVGAEESVVLGTADVEIRSVATVQKPVVSAALERYRAPRPLSPEALTLNAGDFIRRARESCGISFREASSDRASSLANWVIAVTIVRRARFPTTKLGSFLHGTCTS